ncbi:conserved hypothetical protein [Planktothrix sp. PCC 11201]|uniref:hypothetical protein n=1 Tax=Planktothrix sp. PCC 11201 TaxID=1729650 RepID=UPI0009209893|nr:hypothetical protein [Planktothrix sp. PCC 11201]SKB14369.1 conserved hypothetical protein [Planktothrix sp. PCC 11201]
MGKQSKLKHKRQDLKNHPPEILPEKNNQDPTHFVETMEKQGYHLKTTNSCPDIPKSEDGKPKI